jgi:hypothetical protein
MPLPIALCLEDLNPPSPADRYLRCVALVGRQPGLRLGSDGVASWQSEQPSVCELWASADDRLILYRTSSETAVAVSRAGRSLDPPCGKPVVLLDGDELSVGGRLLRVHVHGTAPQIAAPSLLPARLRDQAVRATAVLAIGAAVAACDKKETIEVRDQPPAVAEVEPDASTAPSASAPTTATASASASASTSAPIEVRETPPEPPALPPKDRALPKPHKPSK